MCVIITLSPGASINKDQLFNAVYNNWHGYGLVLRDSNNRIQVIKKFYPDNVGTDPEEVWNLLEDNKDITRYLHLRHATKGGMNEDNVQPFSVYNSNARQVYFMHNGTLGSFGSYTTTGDGKSDTREFCEKILQPALLHWSGENGKADYLSTEFYRLIMDKHWAGSSTGLFVSNDLEPRRIGSGWSEYKHPDESSSGEVWTSNTTYYDRIQRGPTFQKMEAERRKKEEEERKASVINGVPFQNDDNNTTKNTTGISKWGSNNCAKSPQVMRAFNNIFNKWDFDNPSDVSKLMHMATEEIAAYLTEFDEPYTIAVFIEVLIKSVWDNQVELKKLKNQNARQEKYIRQYNIVNREGVEKNVA